MFQSRVQIKSIFVPKADVIDSNVIDMSHGHFHR